MDKKRIYQEKIKAQLEKVSPKIYRLKAKTEQVNLVDGIDYYKQIEKLKAMRDLLRLELQELKEIEEDPGEDFEKRIQDSVNDLKETLDLDI
jgi:small-conductance mechanosensitive channel